MLLLKRRGLRSLWPALLAWWMVGGASAAEPGNDVVSAPWPLFVSILPQQYLAEQVGGDRVRVTVLVGPGRSPETYEPTPMQLSRLSQARLYWRIGADFEATWLPRVLRRQPALQVLDARTGLALRPSVEDHAGAGRHAHFDDPHVWLDPRLAKQMSAALRDTLIRLDPAGRAVYAANYDRLAARLDALHAELQAVLQQVRGRTLLVFHPAWGYFTAAYGLEQLAVESHGKAPGPRSLATVIERGRRSGVRTLFVQSASERAHAAAVARAIGADVAIADPLAPDYDDNLRRVARHFAEALR